MDFEIAIISLIYDVISISHINITMTVDMTQIYHIHFISNHLRSLMPETIVVFYNRCLDFPHPYDDLNNHAAINQTLIKLYLTIL